MTWVKLPLDMLVPKPIECMKMHGLGNDFVVMHDDEDLEDLYAPFAKSVCKRRTSVGADGLIVALPSDVADIRMRIFNADGSEAQMCGNGIRCFAKYVYEQGLVKKDEFSVETLAGIMRPKLSFNDDEDCEGNKSVKSVRVDMGKPDFTPANIPMNAESSLTQIVEVAGRELTVSAVLMGVPHAVIFVDEALTFDEVANSKIGSLVENADIFPENANVNFVTVKSDDNIVVNTWERGAGATLACGTGSCASVVIANALNLVKSKVTVDLYEGSLEIEIAEDGRVYMTGPATNVAKIII